MKVPRTFISNKTLDSKIKKLLSKKGLYEEVIEKYGVFKTDKTNYINNCYFAIKSILQDEGYKDIHVHKSANNIRILLLDNLYLNNKFCLEGYMYNQKFVIIDLIKSMDEAQGLANRLNEELKSNLKLKQYIGGGAWEEVKPN